MRSGGPLFAPHRDVRLHGPAVYGRNRVYRYQRSSCLLHESLRMTQTKKPKPGAKDAKSNSTLWWILGGIVGLGLIVALAISIAGEDGRRHHRFRRSDGHRRPAAVYAAGQEDVSVGLTAPSVEGADWEGNPVTIEPNGTPRSSSSSLTGARIARPTCPSSSSGSTMGTRSTTSN